VRVPAKSAPRRPNSQAWIAVAVLTPYAYSRWAATAVTQPCCADMHLDSRLGDLAVKQAEKQPATEGK
jgi:hypothetical protein